jgi:hypothetical protein
MWAANVHGPINVLFIVVEFHRLLFIMILSGWLKVVSGKTVTCYVVRLQSVTLFN